MILHMQLGGKLLQSVPALPVTHYRHTEARYLWRQVSFLQEGYRTNKKVNSFLWSKSAYLQKQWGRVIHVDHGPKPYASVCWCAHWSHATRYYLKICQNSVLGKGGSRVVVWHDNAVCFGTEPADMVSHSFRANLADELRARQLNHVIVKCMGGIYHRKFVSLR
jgi:hypothetical protein